MSGRLLDELLTIATGATLGWLWGSAILACRRLRRFRGRDGVAVDRRTNRWVIVPGWRKRT